MFIFESTSNTRAVLPGSTKYIRSDLPTSVTESERLWLLENGIATVIDLRTDKERLAMPCPLADDGRFTYHCIPLTDGDRVPDSVAAVPMSYIRMVDSEFERVMTILLSATGGVLYFCNAGKDRTGVVSAILLHRLGYDEEYIVKDYMQSRDNLYEKATVYLKEHPDVDVEVITPRESNIRELLAWYRSENR